MSPMMNVPSVIQHRLHNMNQVTPRPNHMDGHIGNLPINMSSNLITPSFEHALRPSNVLDSQINSTQTHIDDATNMASSSNDFCSTHHEIPSKVIYTCVHGSQLIFFTFLNIYIYIHIW